MFLTTPNLPDNKVTLCAIAEGYHDLELSLKKLGIHPLKIKDDGTFNLCEANHPDMHLHHLGDNKIVVYKEDEYLIKELADYGFEIIFADTQKNGEYPRCTALNACRIGNKLLAGKRALDKKIADYADKNNVEIINCNQGYCRCASAVISENAVITSDPSVYKSLCSKVDVLKISQGNIKLHNLDDGMIGGTCGLVDKNILAFYGNIDLHPDGKEIRKFLKKHSVQPLCLSENPLCDVGGILPLKQSKNIF